MVWKCFKSNSRVKKHWIRVYLCPNYKVRIFWKFHSNFPVIRKRAWHFWLKYWSEWSESVFNRILVSKNIGLGYKHALVMKNYCFSKYPKIFPRSKKGVATLTFPQLQNLNKNFWRLYGPIRVDSCTQTLGTNFFTDAPTIIE